MKSIASFLFLLLLVLPFRSFCQHPFEAEVKALSATLDKKGWTPGATVFTGSSTIRMWTQLQADFSKQLLINTGFGGSQTSDLKKFLYPLVLRFEPARVFIYEGDNDIFAGKSTETIMQDMGDIVQRIQLLNPAIQVYLISAKPSPSRWAKKENYLALNQAFEAYCDQKTGVTYVDTWTPMLNKKGNPKKSIFLEDQLHLNKKGYKLWKKTIAPHLRQQDPKQ